MLEIANISFNYKYKDLNNKVLENACLALPEGRTVLLLGSSGSGKSTLAKIAAGLLNPDQGSVKINGYPAINNGSWNKVGYLFQNPECQLFMDKVYDEIICGPLNVGFSDAEAKAITEDLISKLKLENIAKEPINKLSGGEKQKVAIAAMLSMQPSYLILDEPTAMMDDLSINLLFNLISEYKEEKNMAVLIITQRDEYAKHADQIMKLQNGVIISVGTGVSSHG